MHEIERNRSQKLGCQANGGARAGRAPPRSANGYSSVFYDIPCMCVYIGEKFVELGSHDQYVLTVDVSIDLVIDHNVTFQVLSGKITRQLHN